MKTMVIYTCRYEEIFAVNVLDGLVTGIMLLHK
jgi:hypothetical protein